MAIILVTGANRGIGFEICRQLSGLGHDVIISARDPEKCKAAAEQLSAEGLVVTPFALDVNSEADIQSLYGWINERYGKLDVLINNAAIMLKPDHSLLNNEDALLLQTLQTNALSPLVLCRKLLPLMQAGSRIIMMSSGGGSMVDPVGGWSPAYCVSKSLLNAITRQLAYELSEKRILVNAMCPGWVKTEMGGPSAPRSVQKGAETAVWLSTIQHLESGKFWRDMKIIPW